MQPLSAPRGYRPFSVGNGSELSDVWQAPEPLVAQNETAPYPIDALPTPSVRPSRKCSYSCRRRLRWWHPRL